MSDTSCSRRWVLQFGGGVLLTGFSGAPAPAADTLPPGLYLPSTNHLAHVLKAAAQARPLADYRPRFFTPGAMEVIRQIVGAILGDIPNAPVVLTDIVNWIDLTLADAAEVRAAAASLSPAHRALAVQYYGAEAVRHLETFDPRKICREGLAAIDAGSLNAQLHIALDADTAEDTPAVRFLRYLKQRAIDGYYTSREGLRELDFQGNSFYSQPPGCA